MRELTSIVLEMERQSKRLGGLFQVGRLNTMRRAEFRDLVAIADRLMVNLADFNALHFGPSRSLRRKRAKLVAVTVGAPPVNAHQRKAQND
jgi:hypothetical protein